MFDDLHDPHPPTPGSSELASVAERARQLRWRRNALVTGTAAVLLVSGLAVAAATDGDGSDRLGSAEQAPQQTPVGGATTTMSSTIDDATPGTAAPASISSPTTTVLSASQPARLSVITASGDAAVVTIDGDGAMSVVPVFDGPDPDDPPPDEGEVWHVDSVALVDGSLPVLVSTCCEPVPGSAFRLDGTRLVSVADVDVAIYGHALALSPAGAQVAMLGGGFEAARQLAVAPADDLAAVRPVPFEAEGATPIDVAWIDEQTLAVVGVSEQDGISLFAIDAGAGRVLGSAPLAGGLDDVTTFRLAGLDGMGRVTVLYTNALTESQIWFFDPRTLAPADAQRQLPAPALSASYGPDGQLLWVGEDRQLRIDDGPPIDGEYIWATW